MTDAADHHRLRSRRHSPSRPREARSAFRGRLGRFGDGGSAVTGSDPAAHSCVDHGPTRSAPVAVGALVLGYLILIALFTALLTSTPNAATSASQPPDLTSPMSAAPSHVSSAPHGVTSPAVVRQSDRSAQLPTADPMDIAVTPRAIRIPAINATSNTVERLGLNPDKTLQTPPLTRVSDAGWYTGSSVPGDPGPAVVVAHVDGRGKLGLFAKLPAVRVGDLVEIDRSDGQTATFRVTSNVSFPKAEFPTSTIYGDTPGPELRLLTCTGRLDKAHHNYLDQEVVFASLISMRPTA